MPLKHITKIIVFFLILIPLVGGCKKQKAANPVLAYMKNSTLTYDNKEQRDNIFEAMKDILFLSKEDLELRRYKDPSGKEHHWDMKTLFKHHFKPNRPDVVLDEEDFYDYVRADSVKSIATDILHTY